MNRERWLALMRVLGFPANADTFDALCAAYAQQHRHYHTAEHVQACLYHLDTCARQAERPAEIELALWFHDAIYQPLSNNNEARSAAWCAEFLQANAAAPDVAERLRRLIMATQHDVAPQTRDESLLLDIDLAILGADAAAYAQFEAAVRKEYRIVPMLVYRKKRVAVLNGFLQRTHIYLNQPFQAEREQQARANLAHAILQLSSRNPA